MKGLSLHSFRSAWLALVFAFVVTAFSTMFASPQEKPAFSTRRDAVNVDVLVTRDGALVRGLTTANFEVKDNGVPQTVDSVSTEPVQLDVAVVLGPVAQPKPRPGVSTFTNIEAQSAAAEALRKAFAPEDHVQIVPFTSAIRLPKTTVQDLNLRESLDARWGQRGLLPMRDALLVALTTRHHHPGRFLVVLLSDGLDGRSWSSRDQVIEVARRTDAVVYVLKARHQWPQTFAKPEFLDAVADVTGGRVISAEREELSEYMTRLLEECRARYLVSYQPTSASAGWHSLEVTLKAASGRVVARRGYWVE